MASFSVVLGVDCGRWPLNGKACFLVANEVLNPASCLYQEHLGQPQPAEARQWSQSSISTKVCPFKSSTTLGHKLPHFIKWRQNRMRTETAPFFFNKETIVCLHTPSFPGLAMLSSLKERGKSKRIRLKCSTVFVLWKCNTYKSCNCHC